MLRRNRSGRGKRGEGCRYKNTMSFKWNDAMLGVFLIRITAFPSSGSTENLADKARRTSFRYWP